MTTVNVHSTANKHIMPAKLRCVTCNLTIHGEHPLNDDGTIVIIHVMGGHLVTEISDPTPTTVAVSNIIDTNRQRKDYGDVSALAASIKQFGIIQPIVLRRDGHDVTTLVAGGRRLAALRLLGTTTVLHGKDFVWRDEDLSDSTGALRLQVVELEENLKRQDLHWSEIISAKLKLLTLMQTLRGATPGVVRSPGASHNDNQFGIRSLATMLGENPSVTSRDIQLAGFVVRHPSLATMPTRADAQRKLGVAVTVAAMQSMAKKSSISPTASVIQGDVDAAGNDGAEGQTPLSPGSVPGTAPSVFPTTTTTSQRWTLYEGRFQDNITEVPDASVDLVCTDLPYNIGLGTSSASHSAGLGSFSDRDLDIVSLCADTAVASYRVLRQDRFAVFFYGMNYHQVLYDSLVTAGFDVDVYPFIWLRDRSAPPDGFARYSKTYDPAMVASKGVPRFVRPNLPNSLAIPSVRGAARLHAAQKPVEIMGKFILDMTTEDCVVLDMFAGAGTTGEAAVRSNRKCILFESEPANCVLIRSRLGVL